MCTSFILLFFFLVQLSSLTLFLSTTLNARTNQYIAIHTCLWNSLPVSASPPSYDSDFQKGGFKKYIMQFLATTFDSVLAPALQCYYFFSVLLGCLWPMPFLHKKKSLRIFYIIIILYYVLPLVFIILFR